MIGRELCTGYLESRVMTVTEMTPSSDVELDATEEPDAEP